MKIKELLEKIESAKEDKRITDETEVMITIDSRFTEAEECVVLKGGLGRDSDVAKFYIADEPEE